jgi:DNA uptake protein ComE-like DNA-binding protein
MPTLLSLRDSVFDRSVAEFESYKLPHCDDEPVLPRAQTEKAVNSLADRFASSMVALIRAESLALTKKLESATPKALDKADWGVQRPLEQLLWGLWAEGWDLGQDDGRSEILSRLGADFAAALPRFGNFDSPFIPDNAPGYEDVKDLRKVPLRRSYLEQAIQARVLQLSETVSEEAKAEIKNHLRQYLVGDPVTGKISKKELYSRVNATIDGYPDGVSVPAPGIRLNKDGTPQEKRRAAIRDRAKLIGRTEANGVYTLGKLQTWLDPSSPVKKVRFLTFEWTNPKPGDRPCLKCLPKNGHILDLQSQWRLIVEHYLPPLHGHCKCVLLPMVESNPKDRRMALAKSRTPSKGASLGKWVGVALGATGNAIAVSDEVKAAVQGAIARRQSRKQSNNTTAKTAALALSFAGLAYLVFQYARTQRPAGRSADPTGLVDTVAQQVEPILGEILEEQRQRMGDALKVRPPIQDLLTPKVLNGILARNSPIDQVTLSYLRSLGMSEPEAVRVQGVMKNYMDWMRSQPNIAVAGANLNTSSVRDLVATGYLAEKQARAIVAHARNKPITDIRDLLDIRSVDSPTRKAFSQSQVNRLAGSYLYPDINRLGSFQIQRTFGLSAKVADRIVAARARGGPYSSLNDLTQRAGLGKSTVRNLTTYGVQVSNPLRLPMIQGRPVQAEEFDTLPRELSATQLSNRLTIAQPSLSPAPSSPQAAIDKENLLQYLRETPNSIKGAAITIDAEILKKIPPSMQAKLRADANQYAARKQLQVRTETARLRYDQVVGDAIGSAQVVEEDVRSTLNLQGVDRASAQQLLDSYGISASDWRQQKLKELDRQISLLEGTRKKPTELQTLSGEIASQEESLSAQESTLQQLRDELAGVVTEIAEAGTNSDGVSLSDRQNVLNQQINEYLRILSSPNSTATAADIQEMRQLRENFSGLGNLKNTVDRNPQIQAIDQQINDLQTLQRSRLQGIQASRRNLIETVARLKELRSRLLLDAIG